MILLDINVLSEPFKPAANPAVLSWLDAQAIETLHLSTITLAEIRLGIAALPDGRRRAILHRRLEEQVVPAFTDRIIPRAMAHDPLVIIPRSGNRDLSGFPDTHITRPDVPELGGQPPRHGR